MFRVLLLLASMLVNTVSIAASSYTARFTLTLGPGAQSAKGEIAVKPGTGYIRTLTLTVPASRYSGMSADGTLASVAGQKDRMLWTPPSAGGSFRYTVKLSNKRSNGAFDAMANPTWAIFRSDKVFPKAKVRAKGKSDSELVFNIPKAWHVNVGYERIRDGEQRFSVKDAKRSFDAPAGWVIAGQIANRADVIAGTKVIVSGPEGLGLRRQDMLALLSYNLPEMKRAFGAMPKILLIVSGPDPMWRGGLSGPNSLFLHADRPMISENGTSSLLHELTHSITRVRGAKNADWIAEGMAEFYAIEALRRSGGISDERYKSTLSELKSWSKKVKTLLVERSSAEVTARAALLMIELDAEIQKATNRKKSMDDVTRILIKLGKVSNAEFNKAVQNVLGRPSTTLQSPLLK
jgi:predicted metalloprotease with PDZ domain